MLNLPKDSKESEYITPVRNGRNKLYEEWEYVERAPKVIGKHLIGPTGR